MAMLLMGATLRARSLVRAVSVPCGIVVLVLVVWAAPATGQWSYDEVGAFLRTGIGRAPADADEVMMFTSRAIQHLGRWARPFESYHRCLLQGAVQPDPPREGRYPSYSEHVERFKNGVPPRTSFEAALFVSTMMSALGETAAQPLYDRYAVRCWSLEDLSRSSRPQTPTARIVRGPIPRGESRVVRYRIDSDAVEQVSISVSWASTRNSGRGISILLICIPHSDREKQFTYAFSAAALQGQNRMELGLRPDAVYDVVLHNFGADTTFVLRTQGKVRRIRR